MSKGNLPNSNSNNELEKARLLWEEYKYRHEHVWKLIFQITIAVTIISIIPYTQQKIASQLDKWIIILPVIGILLTFLGIVRLWKEIGLLDGIKKRHREYQQILHGMDPDKKTDTKKTKNLIQIIKNLILSIKNSNTFELHVFIYLVSLLLLELINIWVILNIWLKIPVPTEQIIK